MKKILAFSLILVLAMAAWLSLDTGDMVVTIGDRDFDGPLGALFGTLIAGGVMGFVAIILTCVAVMVGFILAGVGMLMLVMLGFGAVIAAVAISPLFLPVLIPFAIYWLLKRRKQRQPVPALEQAAV